MIHERLVCAEALETPPRLGNVELKFGVGMHPGARDEPVRSRGHLGLAQLLRRASCRTQVRSSGSRRGRGDWNRPEAVGSHAVADLAKRVGAPAVGDVRRGHATGVLAARARSAYSPLSLLVVLATQPGAESIVCRRIRFSCAAWCWTWRML